MPNHLQAQVLVPVIVIDAKPMVMSDSRVMTIVSADLDKGTQQ